VQKTKSVQSADTVNIRHEFNFYSKYDGRDANRIGYILDSVNSEVSGFLHSVKKNK
jgi:hypothetical protein